MPAVPDGWADMLASGRATAAQDATDVADEPPAPYEVQPSDVLRAMRAEDG